MGLLKYFLSIFDLRRAAGSHVMTKRDTRDYPCRNYSFSGAKIGKSYYFFGLILGVLTGKHLVELPGAYCCEDVKWRILTPTFGVARASAPLPQPY